MRGSFKLGWWPQLVHMATLAALTLMDVSGEKSNGHDGCRGHRCFPAECKAVNKREADLVYDSQCSNQHSLLSPRACQNHLGSLLTTPVPEIHPQRCWFNCSWVGSGHYYFISFPGDSDGQPGLRTPDLVDGPAEGGNGNTLPATTRRINTGHAHQALSELGRCFCLLSHLSAAFAGSTKRGAGGDINIKDVKVASNLQIDFRQGLSDFSLGTSRGTWYMRAEVK